jgi:TonB family protein
MAESRLLHTVIAPAGLVAASLLGLSSLGTGLPPEETRAMDALSVAVEGALPDLPEETGLEAARPVEARTRPGASAKGGKAAPAGPRTRLPAGREPAADLSPGSLAAAPGAAEELPRTGGPSEPETSPGGGRGRLDSLESSASKGLKVVRRTRVLETAPSNAETGPPPPRRVAVPPRATYQPRPSFPPEARDKDVEGSLVVRVLVAEDGSVARYEVTGGERRETFEPALPPVVPAWRFKPALDAAGKPIECWKEFTVAFKLENVSR